MSWGRPGYNYSWFLFQCKKIKIKAAEWKQTVCSELWNTLTKDTLDVKSWHGLKNQRNSKRDSILHAVTMLLSWQSMCYRLPKAGRLQWGNCCRMFVLFLYLSLGICYQLLLQTVLMLEELRADLKCLLLPFCSLALLHLYYFSYNNSGYFFSYLVCREKNAQFTSAVFSE